MKTLPGNRSPPFQPFSFSNFDMRKVGRSMFHTTQFPHAYKKDDSQYVYFTDSGERIEIKAGKDGVTEAQIAALKALHREELRSDKRYRRVKWKDGESVYEMLSFDSHGDDSEEDRMHCLTDPDADPEEILLRALDKAASKERLSRLWRRLNDQQRRLLCDLLVHKMSEKEIAIREGVTPGAISHRLQTLRKIVLLILRE